MTMAASASRSGAASADSPRISVERSTIRRRDIAQRFEVVHPRVRESEAVLDVLVAEARDQHRLDLAAALRHCREGVERGSKLGANRHDVARVCRLVDEVRAARNLQAEMAALLAVEPPRPVLGGGHEPRAPVAFTARLAADELHPCEVACVVDDVRRRVDQALDTANQPTVVALEQLGLVAKQPRAPWWALIRPCGRRFGNEIGPRIGPRRPRRLCLLRAETAALQGVS
jgi:hypothetical protein